MKKILHNRRPAVNSLKTRTTKGDILSSSERPKVLKVAPQGIPPELKELVQWVAWKQECRQGKDGKEELWTKVPVDPKTGRNARTNESSTWGTFERALAAVKRYQLDGIGFVFTEDDLYAGIDLDDCRDPNTGELDEWAAEYVNRLASYTEISPTGTGVKVWVKGKLPPGGNKKGVPLPEGALPGLNPGVEMYDRLKFFTVTGHRLEGACNGVRKCPKTLKALHAELFASKRAERTDTPGDPAMSGSRLGQSDEEIIAKAMGAKNGEKFKRLWAGDTTGFPSQSEAVMALCGLLAFWTGGDAERIDRLFRQSGLHSGKWLEKWGRLGQETISRVLEGRSGFYKPEAKKGCAGENAEGRGRESQASQLVAIVQASGVELFHTLGGYDSEGYATLDVGGHRETWPVSSNGFRRWLGKRFFDAYGKVPGSQALQDALNVIAGKAVHEGPEQEIAVRLAEQDGIVWLDLADADWRAVRIGPEGWSIVTNCQVRFVRRRGMLPLPAPVPGGDLKRLRQLVNLPDDDAWVLFVAWLVAALRPGRPFPVLAVNGEQGSAKTTLCRMARGLIDPNQAELRRPPRTERDLMIAATNGWIVGYDNLSGILPDLSDGLCSLATGGGFGTRQLYSDDEEKLFSATRPILLNGIEDIATRADLLDRAIALTLPTIPDERRRDEDELWRKYEKRRPHVLGALLDVLSAGLRNLPRLKLDRLPRMADFAKLVTACEPALDWPPGTFLAAYDRNRALANDAALESSPIVKYLLLLVEEKGWSGTAAQLLLALNGRADDNERRLRVWPATPRGLSGALRRLAPNLRRAGVNVVFTNEQTRRGKRILLEKAGEEPLQPLQPLHGPKNTVNSRHGAQRLRKGRAGQPLHENSVKTQECNGRNGCNGEKRAYSGRPHIESEKRSYRRARMQPVRADMDEEALG